MTDGEYGDRDYWLGDRLVAQVDWGRKKISLANPSAEVAFDSYWIKGNTALLDRQFADRVAPGRDFVVISGGACVRVK